MGFEYWEVGFGKKLGWEMGLVPPLQDPPSTLARESKSENLNENHLVTAHTSKNMIRGT